METEIENLKLYCGISKAAELLTAVSRNGEVRDLSEIGKVFN
jgi:hypothetical protein